LRPQQERPCKAGLSFFQIDCIVQVAWQRFRCTFEDVSLSAERSMQKFQMSPLFGAAAGGIGIRCRRFLHDAALRSRGYWARAVPAKLSAIEWRSREPVSSSPAASHGF
jgi:hypothetical protein